LPGIIIHQGPVRKIRAADGKQKKGACEAADALGIEMSPRGPGSSFFVAEGKKEKLMDALMGVASYANLCSCPNDGTTKNVGVLGLAITTRSARLSVYFKDSNRNFNRMHMITVVPEEKPYSIELLAVVCAGNRYLCNSQLLMEKHLAQPLPWIESGAEALTEKTECRTFIKGESL
jgi:hypothetical protein